MLSALFWSTCCAAALLSPLAFAEACAQEATGVPAPPGEATLPPPPDPAEVLAEEFRYAIAEGSNAALIRFIARHPDEALTEEARRLLAARKAPDPQPADDPDGSIFAAFDAARLAGSPEAMLDFAARYPNHPLAQEARRNAGVE